MKISELISVLSDCDPNHEVKIFNIERMMDILQIDTDATHFDSEACEEIPLNQVWFGIGFMNDSDGKVQVVKSNA